MTLAKQARAVERDFFGALIGALLGLVVCRIAVFVVDLDPFTLSAALFVGAWTGAAVAHLGVRRSIAATKSVRSLAAAVRAIALRVILWLLGIAAVLGVLAVLTGSFEVVGRVAATTAVTAMAALLMLPMLSLLDQDKTWRVGLLGVASVMSAYLLGVPSIWELGYRPAESVFSGLTVALMMPTGLVAMYLSHSRETKIAGFFLALTYATSTTLFLLAIWSADTWNSTGELFEIGFVVLGYGALASLTTVRAITGDRRYWRWIGFAAAIVAGAMCVMNVLERRRFDVDWVFVVTSIAVVVGHANLALLSRLKPGQVWWKYATIVAAMMTAASLDAVILTESGGRGISTLGRVSLASGILTSTGSLALLILTRLNSRSVAVNLPGVAGALSSIEVRCPRCGTVQTVPLGSSGCGKCSLGFSISIDPQDSSATDQTGTREEAVEPVLSDSCDHGDASGAGTTANGLHH